MAPRRIQDRTDVGWDPYVQRFHAERPGITERLLARSVDGEGRTPYGWVSEGLPPGEVLDLGCGSGPTGAAVDGWVGADRSRAELAVAHRAGRGPLVLAEAAELPLRSRSVGAAVAAMSLMVLSDPAAALDEVARVVRPGGVLHLLLPADRPLTAGDRVRYGLLLAVLARVALPFPRPEVARDPGPLLTASGFVVTDDQHRAFRFPVEDDSAADLFIESLYLPGISARRVGLARTVVRRWGRGDISIPLRRVTAQRAGPPPLRT
jgi:SAM-dependent methyltransferase